MLRRPPVTTEVLSVIFLASFSNFDADMFKQVGVSTSECDTFIKGARLLRAVSGDQWTMKSNLGKQGCENRKGMMNSRKWLLTTVSTVGRGRVSWKDRWYSRSRVVKLQFQRACHYW